MFAGWMVGWPERQRDTDKCPVISDILQQKGNTIEIIHMQCRWEHAQAHQKKKTIPFQKLVYIVTP